MYRERKTSSHFGGRLYGALISEEPWEQAENLPSDKYIDFYVGKRNLSKLNCNSNQLILGRRGTGKTHILKAFNQEINQSNFNTYSIYLSCSQMSDTPPDFSIENEEEKRARFSRYLLNNLLSRLSNALVISYESIIRDRLEKKYPKIEIEKRKLKIEDKILKIMDEISKGSAIIVSNKKKYVEAVDKESGNESSTLGFFGFSQEKIFANLKYKFSRNKKMKASKTEQHNVEYICETNLSKLRSLLHEFVDLVEIDCLYVLIDEWSELEKCSTLSIQPIIANYIKKLFMNTEKFAVKIASIWQFSRIIDKRFSRKSKGIELGQDIQIGIDLDELLAVNEEKTLEFFFKILYKRLSYHLPALKDIERTPDKGFDALIQELFDNTNNFKALIAASHGIPRDFVMMFHECLVKIDKNFNNYAITTNVVKDVAIEAYSRNKRSLVSTDSSTFTELNHRIVDYMERTNRRFFIVKNSEVERIPELQDFTDKKLIQQFPSSITPFEIQDDYKCFYIDYGHYQQWLDSKKRRIDVLFDHTVFPKFPDDFAASYNEYVLDLSDYGSNVMYCEHCDQLFSKKHPVYISFGVCPFCAKKVTVINAV